MKAPRIRLIALDLDGTLLDRRGKVGPATWAALEAAVERGAAVAIATGRSVPAARHAMAELRGRLGVAVPAVACNGGAVLGGDGQLLGTHAIPSSLVPLAAGSLRAAGLTLAFYTPGVVWVDQPWRQVWDLLRRGSATVGSPAAAWRLVRRNRWRPILHLDRWLARRRPEPVLKIFAYGTGVGAATRMAAAADQLAARIPQLGVTRSAADNLEVMGPGVDKGRGLQTLAAALRIPRQAVMAVGDGENDIPMFRYAAVAVAMAGAPAPVRQAAAWTVPPQAAEGVAAAVRRWVLDEES